jgi:hypothetical protein
MNRYFATDMSFSSSGTPGLFENGDTLTATFTEPLTVVDTTPTTVTLSQAAGGSTATITIPGLTVATGATIPSGSYFNATGGSAQWNATVDRSGTNITVTLTSDCIGPDCANLTNGSSVNMHVDLATDLEDAVGLPALTTVLVNIRWF